MKIRECSMKAYKRWLINDVVLEISEIHQSNVFHDLSEETQKKLNELCEIVPDGIPVIQNGVIGISLACINFYKEKDPVSSFSKSEAKYALRNWANLISEFKQAKDTELILFFGKKRYGSDLFIPCSVSYSDAYVLVQLFDNLSWYDKEWQQKPYMKLKI